MNMGKSVIRIKKITIQNFKNVVNGSLLFENHRKNYKSSVLGLYGQNGSGKTALIDAIALLKFALCGRVIPKQYADYVNVDADAATLECEFIVKDIDKKAEYNVNYSFSLKKEIETNSVNVDNSFEVPEEEKTVIFDEILSYSYECGDKKIRKTAIVDTRTTDVFLPKSKYTVLTGNEDEKDLFVVKKLALATSRSFVFSKELLNCIRKKCEEKYHVFLFDALTKFGNFELFIIDTKNSGLISFDALPLFFKYSNKSGNAVGNLPIPLNDSGVIPEQAFEVVNTVTENMNTVLSQLIPNLTIGIKVIGTQTMKNGETGYVIELISRKNKKEIALRYESEGIKKIVSILQLLIVVYNNDSITVAIDELDSGIFEYLLGEILRIISEKGKGQLIFTSHNLRPLETIDKGFVAFTTTNANNRYIRFSNVKTNNNLRDFYYRDIMLGEQDEPVYETTNNYEIALAFREAGDISGS